MATHGTGQASNVRKAKEAFLASKTPISSATVWQMALDEAEGKIKSALRDSNMLLDVSSALSLSGSHMMVYRHLMAPPTSQDQFKLLCPTWSKASEKSTRGIRPAIAKTIADIFDQWRDKRITAWVTNRSRPKKSEIDSLVSSIAPLMASQNVSTVERNRLSAKQEGDVIGLLKRRGWTQDKSMLVDTRAAIPIRHFMHKTRFATRTRPQEVDIACGLRDTFVLAMECKVTNDETNSVKRINDVLKKATAWREHWGSFVTTAALLQGVIAEKDANRLVDAGVLVFWSHDLDAFEAWIASQV